eukprot:scaffold21770_cov18-Tisochrysis_lutea.AAC.1
MLASIDTEERLITPLASGRPHASSVECCLVPIVSDCRGTPPVQTQFTQSDWWCFLHALAHCKSHTYGL